MSALKDDVPVLEPSCHYNLKTNARKKRGRLDIKYRYECGCGERGEWVAAAGMALGAWNNHIVERAAAKRRGIYGDNA